MTTTGNNIFTLEVIVYRVTLTDQVQVQNTCPVCVCFRFPGLIEMVICEGGFCADGTVGGGEVRMTEGKSSLFALNSANLYRTARDFYAIVSVNRRVTGEQKMRYVAQTRLDFDRAFTNLITDPDQVQKTRKLRQVLPLYDSDRPMSVGTVDVQVRLTSRGSLVVTHFSRAPDSKQLQYKPVSEYVPAQGSAVKCCDKTLHCKPKRTCRHRQSCRNKQTRVSENNDDSSYCVPEMEQANCVLTMMEKLKGFYEEMKTAGPYMEESGEQANPCMFDLNCPAVRCPFRTGEPANAFVGHLVAGTHPGDGHLLNGGTRPADGPLPIAGTRPGGGRHPNAGTRPGGGRHPNAGTRPVDGRLPIDVEPSDISCDIEQEDHCDGEIVDDADLFVVNTGRVDPCRVTAPLVYQEVFTQCNYTDFSTEWLPPTPVVTKPKKGKKSKKSKKAK